MPYRGSSAGRILVVDDQPANRRVVSLLLSRHGYQVDCAGSGEEALRRYAECHPDLILLDMMMPGMDGFEVLAHLRARTDPFDVPVVFITAAHDQSLLLKAFDAGAVDYVTKPYLPEELLARIRAHVGLKLTRDRLQRVAREREELVDLVSHDLKNPLATVLFASDVLRNQACRPERVPRYVQMIRDSASDALGYIKHYLDRQAGAGRGKPGGACTLNTVLAWLAERYSEQLEAHGITLEVSLAPPDACVAIDANALRQACENLLTNAMKYAPGGPLLVAGRRGEPGYWQLVVADRGPGIPADRRRDLFRPFVRLHEAKGGGDGSSGLGLALVKRTLQDAGGHLWYEPREGGGSVFVMELPGSGECEAADVRAPDRSAGGNVDGAGGGSSA